MRAIGSVTVTQARPILMLAAIAAIVAIVLGIVIRHRKAQEEVKILMGCILRDDPDPRKQVPIAGVEIQSDLATAPARSESSGLFRLALQPGVEAGEIVSMRLRHPDYQPASLDENASVGLYILRMKPIPAQASRAPEHP